MANGPPGSVAPCDRSYRRTRAGRIALRVSKTTAICDNIGMLVVQPGVLQSQSGKTSVR